MPFSSNGNAIIQFAAPANNLNDVALRNNISAMLPIEAQTWELTNENKSLGVVNTTKTDGYNITNPYAVCNTSANCSFRKFC